MSHSLPHSFTPTMSNASRHTLPYPQLLETERITRSRRRNRTSEECIPAPSSTTSNAGSSLNKNEGNKQVAIDTKANQAREMKARAAEQRELMRYKKLITEVLKARDTALKCESCNLVMTRPFTLECEHTFCYSCTKTSFHSDLKQQIKYRNVPPELHAPFDAEKLEKLYEGKYIHVALYGCPTCGKLATKRPREHPLLRHLVDSLGRTLGLPADFAEKYVEAPRKGDIWSGIYRPQRLVSTEAGGEEAGAAV